VAKNLTNEERAKKLADKISSQVKRATSKGLGAASIFLVSRVKETLNISAPKVKVIGKTGALAGITYYRALTPATAGAPPRKLSGALQKSVVSENRGDNTVVIGTTARSLPTRKYPRGINYGKFHEIKGSGKRSGQHPFVVPTVEKYKKELATIVGLPVKAVFK
jgi:hypothetical protein